MTKLFGNVVFVLMVLCLSLDIITACGFACFEGPRVFSVSIGNRKRGVEARVAQFQAAYNHSLLHSTELTMSGVNVNATNMQPRIAHPDCNPFGFYLLRGRPSLCGFPNRILYDYAAHVVLNGFELALAGSRAAAYQCGPTHPSLNGYFDIETTGVRDAVIRVLAAIHNADKLGPPGFLTAGLELEIWYQPALPYGYRIPEWNNCDHYPVYATASQYVTSTPGFCKINLWTQVFHKFPHALDQIQSDIIADGANKDILDIDAGSLHEPAHWARFIQKYTNLGAIFDWNPRQDPSVNPPDGYLLHHAYQLRQEGKTPVFNVDIIFGFALSLISRRNVARPFEIH